MNTKNKSRWMPSAPSAPEAARKAAAEGDLAYKMAKWPRLLFRNETKEGGFINDALGMRTEGTWPAVCREMFGRLYGNGTTKLDDGSNGWAENLHRQADAVPEWAALEQSVRGDAWRAALGAGQVAAVLAASLPPMPDENQEALEAEAEVLREVSQDGKRVNANLMAQRGELQRRIAKATQDGEATCAAMDAGQGFAIRSALRKAAQQATQTIEEVDAGMQGMGIGSAATPAERRALQMQMAGDERLRRIAVLAGRLRMQAARKQATKTTQERREIVSIKLGDDLQHLVASEIGMLAVTASRPFVLERIAEKRALQYELGGKATKTRGPLVFLIDASGSMDGHREEWAKACAMAMMEIARIQRRPFAVVFFDGGIKHSTFFAAGEASTEKIIDLMGVRCTGGTNIEQALAYAVQIVACTLPECSGWKAGKDADVVLITDGEDCSDYQTPSAALKAAGASIYTIAIECSASDALKAVSAETLSMSSKDMQAASSKLDGVFSI